MAITTRQNRTLAAEDWKRVYQSFQNADFQSYDFETLRKTMIDYLRIYYPENFNDYIESSEYIALIDLIAWLGQNLAFRTDLNARENFIDTAERRDSVLKLAKLINYNPKRTVSGSGLLKINSISTTESVLDSDGINLANIAIFWNDSNNENWQDQFRSVLNASLVNSQTVGRPGNTQTILGVRTEEYSINLNANAVPLVPFTATVSDLNMIFEAVSATSVGKDYLYERTPLSSQTFNIVYRNDNLGNSSVNTGFFVMFKQGQLTNIDFPINESLPNRVINIDTQNINQDDHWLYQVDSNGNENTLWSEVPSVAGVNVIYNNSIDRNIYQVNSRQNDQVDLVFGDGSFSNIPKGNFRFYYRITNGLTYKITTKEMQNIILTLNYVSRTNRVETLTIRASLQYTVNNASARETLAEIKSKAPQQYYTLSRMISGEDYNIYPYTAYSSIVKVKAVNRTSSGISRFLDMVDASGKYSRTNIFAQDGILYKSSGIQTQTFSFAYSSDLDGILRNTIFPYVSRPEMLHFYYENYPISAVPATLYWKSVSEGANLNTGYFTTDASVTTPVPQTIGSGSYDMIKPGSILKISAPAGKYFNAQNILVDGTPSYDQEKTYFYVVVNNVDNSGLGNASTGIRTNGLGAVYLNNNLPTGAIITSAIISFNNNLTSLIESIKTNLVASNTFGLVLTNGVWAVDTTINVDAEFDLNSSTANWLVAFRYQSGVYQVKFRSLFYYFESDRETNFFFDRSVRVFDTKTASILKDQINVLRINRNPLTGNSYQNNMIWNIYDSFVEIDGYQNPKKVLVTYADLDNDSVPDNPYLFDEIVADDSIVKNKVFFELVSGYDSNIEQRLVDNTGISFDYASLSAIETNKNKFKVGQLFYASSEKKVYQLELINSVRVVVEKTNYVYNIGRQGIYFQYQHNSPDYRRIDPSTTNIVDLYVLTRSYSQEYFAWLRDTSGVTAEPEKPTTEQLNQEYQGLDNVKSISDTIIVNPATFKPLFGSKAEETLRATFKVVKNPNVFISDNEVKTSVIAAINSYFDVDNWDFGESFYFSELSAYLHRILSPNIASIIIVPTSASSEFGDLLQVNAMPNEIITSSATVDNVEVVSSVTAAQIGRLL